jgi:hypothetical protein
VTQLPLLATGVATPSPDADFHLTNVAPSRAHILLNRYLDRLIEFEKTTIKDIVVRGFEYKHSHLMPISKISKKALNRLNKLLIEHENRCQLELGKTERLWGFVIHNVFHIIWLDKNHTVYPMD